MDNHLETLATLGACGYLGCNLFAVNTGARGDTLVGVVNQCKAPILITSENYLPLIDTLCEQFEFIDKRNILVVPNEGGHFDDDRNLLQCCQREVGEDTNNLKAPAADVQPDTPLIVIYTSGTTGLPKGIVNTNQRLCETGKMLADGLGLGQQSVAYACMPIYHTNSLMIAVMPSFWAGGRVLVKECFRASQFVDDVLHYGVTYWNYVGEPVHYVLAAIRNQYGDDEARIKREITEHPNNHFLFAMGGGATAPDIDSFKTWFGLAAMTEVYGQSESVIGVMTPMDGPRGCVGEILDPAVKILRKDGSECVPAELDAQGNVINYAEAVGELCRLGNDSTFAGYFENEVATREKFLNGIYHSGDLACISVRDGRRFLYFQGRTGDWIRKDGENFSAVSVAHCIYEHPEIPLAAAYGVPCPVSDEWVMIAIKLGQHISFQDLDLYSYCANQQEKGSLGSKWFPEFVRIVDDFDYNKSHKILTASLKAEHYNLEAMPEAEIYWRERGDTSFKPFRIGDYQRLKAEFERNERLSKLNPGMN